MIDAAVVRSHFPALQSGTLFFDNPAGTQIAGEALEEVERLIAAVRDLAG